MGASGMAYAKVLRQEIPQCIRGKKKKKKKASVIQSQIKKGVHKVKLEGRMSRILEAMECCFILNVR